MHKSISNSVTVITNSSTDSSGRRKIVQVSDIEEKKIIPRSLEESDSAGEFRHVALQIFSYAIGKFLLPHVPLAQVEGFNALLLAYVPRCTLN
jgi:hypothetical protein